MGCRGRCRAGCALTLGWVHAHQGPLGWAWDRYLYTQGGAQHGKVDTNLLKRMHTAASARWSVTKKVWQLCDGWLMGANGSTAILCVVPNMLTIVGVDFPKS